MINDIHKDYELTKQGLNSKHIKNEHLNYYKHQDVKYHSLKVAVFYLFPFLMKIVEDEYNYGISRSKNQVLIFMKGQLKGFISDTPNYQAPKINNILYIQHLEYFLKSYIELQLNSIEKRIALSGNYKLHQIHAMIDFYNLLVRIKKIINKRIIKCQKTKTIPSMATVIQICKQWYRRKILLKPVRR